MVDEAGRWAEFLTKHDLSGEEGEIVTTIEAKMDQQVEEYWMLRTELGRQLRIIRKVLGAKAFKEYTEGHCKLASPDIRDCMAVTRPA
jgi:hypothetical protein